MATNYFSDDSRIAWLQKHKGKFSGSRFSELMTPGKIPKGETTGPMFSEGGETYIQEMAIEEYTAFDATERLLSKAMKDGLANEPEAYQHFKNMNGFGSNFEYYGDGNPKFFDYQHDSGASPDCVLWKPDETASLGLEIKCPTKKTYWEYRKAFGSYRDGIKDSNILREVDFTYWCQVQFTMMVMNTDLWLWGAYNPFFPAHQRGLIIEVPKDLRFQEKAALRLKMAYKKKWEYIAEQKAI